MKERSPSERVCAFAMKHPGFFSTVLVIAVNVFLLFFYSAHLGRLPPLFGLSFSNAVIMFLGAIVVGTAVVVLAGSYAIVPLLAGPPRLAGGYRSLRVWLFFLMLPVEALILAVVFCLPQEYALGGAFVALLFGRGGLALLSRWGGIRVFYEGRWRIVEGRLGHYLLIAFVLVFFILWNVVLVCRFKGDGSVFLVIGVMTLSASLLLSAVFVGLHERRLPSAEECRSRAKGRDLSTWVWIGAMSLLMVAVVAGIAGPGPWPVLHVGRYDAACVVEKEGVDALVSECEALEAQRAGGGKGDRSDGKGAMEGFGRELAAKVWGCEEKSSGAYSCRFHVWWGVGDEWLVSRAGAPLWTIESASKGYSILSLASRYVRGCVPIRMRRTAGKDGECGSLVAR